MPARLGKSKPYKALLAIRRRVYGMAINPLEAAGREAQGAWGGAGGAGSGRLGAKAGEPVRKVLLARGKAGTASVGKGLVRGRRRWGRG